MISKGASYNSTYFIWRNIAENQTVPWVTLSAQILPLVKQSFSFRKH